MLFAKLLVSCLIERDDCWRNLWEGAGMGNNSAPWGGGYTKGALLG
jgi:hypothetical protein